MWAGLRRRHFTDRLRLTRAVIPCDVVVKGLSDDATAQSALSHEPSFHLQYSNQPPLVLRFGGPPESV